MTEKEAKDRAIELAPIIQSFANGGTIEKRYSDGIWRRVKAPTWYDGSTYRIAPKHKIRLMTISEALYKMINTRNMVIRFTFGDSVILPAAALVRATFIDSYEWNTVNEHGELCGEWRKFEIEED